MFKNLFGSSEPQIKPMDSSHISQVVQIIYETDEDDAVAAEEGFMTNGLEDTFVLVQKGTVLGVVGYSRDDAVPDIAWLSWTYLTSSRQGEGLGSQMMNFILGRLRDQSIRKLFIASSDYREHGRLIYASAHKMYEDFGAEMELTIPDYHDFGEARIIFGLANPDFTEAQMAEPQSNNGISFINFRHDPETKATYVIDWEEAAVGARGLEAIMDKARANNAKLLVVEIPDDISTANRDALVTAGFTEAGKLKNFYGIGQNQIVWVWSSGSVK